VTGQMYRQDRDLFLDILGKRKSKKRDAAYAELWSKYDNLRTALKFKLIKTARNHRINVDLDIEEYDSRAYEIFMRAIDTVDLDRCKHIKNWSAYILFWGNWMSMNRDIISHYIKDRHNTKPIQAVLRHDSRMSEDSTVTNVDVEVSRTTVDVLDVIEAEQKRKLFWDAYSLLEAKMNKRQKKIAKRRNEGVSPREIKRELGITNKSYMNEIDGMKRDFSCIIRSLSKNGSIDTSYADLLETFG
jgi:hypothetical protein